MFPGERALKGSIQSIGRIYRRLFNTTSIHIPSEVSTFLRVSHFSRSPGFFPFLLSSPSICFPLGPGSRRVVFRRFRYEPFVSKQGAPKPKCRAIEPIRFGIKVQGMPSGTARRTAAAGRLALICPILNYRFRPTA